MHVHERAEILRRLEECRVALAATITSLESAEEGVPLRATLAPTKQDVDQFIDSLQKEADPVQSFDRMVNELEWLALPPSRTMRAEGVADSASQSGSVDVLRSTEISLEEIRAAISDVAVLLAALEHGGTEWRHEYREKRRLVAELAAHCDTTLQQITALRERMEGTAVPRQDQPRRRRDDR
jgi:hypothetical protein